MICPECNGSGETIYYVETDRDENSVTLEQRKGICRTCNGSGAKPMTHADRIRAMGDEEMAKRNVRMTCICSDEAPYELLARVWETSDGCTFFAEEDAVQYELGWLQLPAEVD